MAPETILQLPARTLFKVPDTNAVAVRCVEGTLWATLDNDPRDYVLEPGDNFAAPAGGHCLLYALAPARFALRGVEEAPAMHPQEVATA